MGESLNPEDVSEKLDMNPDQYWENGDRKSFLKKNGKVHYFDSIHEYGGWKKFLPLKMKNSNNIEEQLNYWVHVLKNKHKPLKELSTEHQCKLDLFATTESTASIVMSAELIQSLAKLNLELQWSFSHHQC